MGCWSEFCKCSQPYLIIPLSKAPREFIQLLEQHSELDNSEMTNDDMMLEDILNTFTDSCRIYGYLTPEYINKWNVSIKWIHSLIQDEDEKDRTFWLMFYCSDDNLFYSFVWNPRTQRIQLREAPNLTSSAR